MPVECFSLCNLIQQIEKKEISDEIFFLSGLEFSLLNFYGYLKMNKKLVFLSIELEKKLYSDFSSINICELKEQLDNVMEKYSMIISKPIIVKMLR
ncbi:hypothetical protein DW182_18385 [Bacteroides sp. AM16-24]|jgi:hypothetical protein|nr:hypothetical protein DW182_18385 [Bacteroides sp. AM16-24]